MPFTTLLAMSRCCLLKPLLAWSRYRTFLILMEGTVVHRRCVSLSWPAADAAIEIIVGTRRAGVAVNSQLQATEASQSFFQRQKQHEYKQHEYEPHVHPTHHPQRHDRLTDATSTRRPTISPILLTKSRRGSIRTALCPSPKNLLLERPHAGIPYEEAARVGFRGGEGGHPK